MRVISIDEYLRLGPSQLANTVIKCPYCHKDHTIPFREILFSPGSIQDSLQVAQRCLGFKPHHIGVIYDSRIEGVVESNALPYIKSPGISVYKYPLENEGKLLEPTDTAGDRAAKQIHSDVEILIGIGSGVVSDLTKYIADKTNRPFLLCGTALSMNAYTSITGVITENKYKISKFLKVCDSVILDPQILCDAPIEMTLAGIGDLAARSICNADFRLSHLLNGTWFCPLPFQLTGPYEAQYFENASKIGQAEIEAIKVFSRANVISGYSMTMVDGETFPSSGAEHVISHFLDLQHELFGSAKNLHGQQVAIGTLISHALYQFLSNIDPGDINIRQIIKHRPPLHQIQQENIQRFGDSGDYLNQVIQEKYLDDDRLAKKLSFIKSNWHILWEDIRRYITPPEKVFKCFSDAGVPDSFSSINRTRAEMTDALLFSNRYRTRYTILDLMWELGLFPEALNEIFKLSSLKE